MEPILDDAGFSTFIAAFTSYERMPSYSYDASTLKLERMAEFARHLGDPQTEYPSVHVAGTKGKGSTCLILEALLSQSLEPIGIYTSPHVEHIRDRIRIGGERISETELCSTVNAILPTLERLRDLGAERFPTFFELMTGLAMTFFRDRNVAYGIFEVGLGGRLDATNILTPSWTAITGIGLEHTRLLGSTLAQVAREKAGIVKPGVPLVLGPVEDEAREAILAVAHRANADVLEVSRRSVRNTDRGTLQVDPFPMEFAPGPIRGPGLRDDLAIAVTLWRRILESQGRSATANDLQTALDRLVLAGRVEFSDTHPPIVLDGAHTPESIRALRVALEEVEFPRPRRLLLSLSSDKRIDSILRELDGLAGEVYFTRADALRSCPPEEVAERYHAVCGVESPPEHIIADPEEAFKRAYSDGWPLVITGSLYLAGALRAAMRTLVRETKPTQSA